MHGQVVVEAKYFFNVDAMLELACASTGYTDFGAAGYREPLPHLFEAMKKEGGLSVAGVQAMHLRVLKSLTDRLQIHAAVKAHPEILNEVIAPPLVITGMTRTGSTKLHRAMAMDNHWRHMPLWEAMFPVPSAGEEDGNPAPRIEASQAICEGMYQMYPQIFAGHPMIAIEPDEETFCTTMSVRTTSWVGFAPVPSYLQWVLENSMKDVYRMFRLTLQYLQWQRGGERKPWLLKCPFHLGFLPDFYKVFPDATVVQCHRKPLIDIVSSCSALVKYGCSMAQEHVDLQQVGRHTLDFWRRSVNQHMDQRDAAPEGWIMDVSYDDIVRNSVEVIERIYRKASVPITDQVGKGVALWETKNPQYKHGKFSYSAEEFGLTEKMVEQEFGRYIHWLNTKSF